LPGFSQIPTLEELLEIYERNWRSEGFESKKHEETRKSQGEQMLRDFYVNNFSPDEKPIELEKSISYQVNDILMKGQVDRIDLIGTEKLEDGRERKIIKIIDYKTGKVKDAKDVEDDLQLSLYAIALEQFDEYRVESASLFFVEHDTIVPAKVDTKNKEKVKARVIELVGDIRKGLFLANPSMIFCKFCDYRTICSDAVV
jgi:CRISPR/Cas system-associated exonuclease Cas4 (RecB family)